MWWWWGLAFCRVLQVSTGKAMLVAHTGALSLPSDKQEHAPMHAHTQMHPATHTHASHTHTHTCAQPHACTHTHTHTHASSTHTHTRAQPRMAEECTHTLTHTHPFIQTHMHTTHTPRKREDQQTLQSLIWKQASLKPFAKNWGRRHSPYTLAHSCRMPTPQQRTVRSTERVQPRAKQQAACSGWSEASCPHSPCWSGRRCVARCVTTASGCGPCCSRRSPQSSAGWTCVGGWSLPARLMTLGTALWWIPLKKSKPGMGGLCSYRRVGMRHWLLFLPSLYSPMQTVISFSDCMYSLFAAQADSYFFLWLYG